MELTFKGKSDTLGGTYAKKESNIKLSISEYIDVCNLLNSLGYYSYVKVVKNRIVYTKKEENLIYNIMIDEIKNLGNFIEIEILCESDNYNTKELKTKLENFTSNFKELKLEIADLPYRDLVANKYTENFKEINNTKLLIDNTKFIKDEIANNSKLLMKLKCLGINISIITNCKDILEFKEVFSNVEIQENIDEKYLKQQKCLTITESKEDMKRLESLGLKVIYINKTNTSDNDINKNEIRLDSFEQFILLLIANYKYINK